MEESLQNDKLWKLASGVGGGGPDIELGPGKWSCVQEWRMRRSFGLMSESGDCDINRKRQTHVLLWGWIVFKEVVSMATEYRCYWGVRWCIVWNSSLFGHLPGSYDGPPVLPSLVQHASYANLLCLKPSEHLCLQLMVYGKRYSMICIYESFCAWIS